MSFVKAHFDDMIVLDNKKSNTSVTF